MDLNFSLQDFTVYAPLRSTYIKISTAFGSVSAAHGSKNPSDSEVVILVVVVITVKDTD